MMHDAACALSKGLGRDQLDDQGAARPDFLEVIRGFLLPTGYLRLGGFSNQIIQWSAT